MNREEFGNKVIVWNLQIATLLFIQKVFDYCRRHLWTPVIFHICYESGLIAEDSLFEMKYK